jgi:hypothetical protein
MSDMIDPFASRPRSLWKEPQRSFRTATHYGTQLVTFSSFRATTNKLGMIVGSVK